MSFYVHKFAWVDVYLDFGCATSYDTPLFNVSGWKGVVVNIMKIAERGSNRGGGWGRYWLSKKVRILYHSVWEYFYIPAAT